MTKSKHLRKLQRRDDAKIRQSLISPQTPREIAAADEYIAAEAKRIKEEFLNSGKMHGARK